MEEFDADGARARSPSPRSAVLWEKIIQQSIFVDLSEDESIHLSDLERSFAVCLSQQESPASASIHLSGEGAELSDSDGFSSQSSDDASQSERVVVGRTKSSVTRTSALIPEEEEEEEEEQRPSVCGDQDAGDTSDEEQEDLPYDGDLLDSRYLNPTAHSQDNTIGDHSGTLQDSPGAVDLSGLPAVRRDSDSMPGLSPTEISATEMPCVSPEEDQSRAVCFIDPARPTVSPPKCSSPLCGAPHPNITQLLLRHFSQDELLHSGGLIEAETLPEVSLLESMDDTVLNTRSPSGVTGIRQSLWETNGEISPSEEDEESHHSDYTLTPDSHVSQSKSEDAEQRSRGSSGPELAEEGEEEEEEAEEGDVEEEEGGEEEGEIQRVSLARTRSFSELKYGQGQVHYRLPDFSKVAPKVKIPKGASGSVGRPQSQSPATILRAQSSPGMLGMSSATRKATVDVISRVLEDTVQPSDTPYLFTAQERPADTNPALVHHLQAEYDKLLTKYAEAENLIDQMRLGTKSQTPSEPDFELDCAGLHDYLAPGGNGSHLGSTPLPTAPLLTRQVTEQQSSSVQADPPWSLTDPQSQSDGEKMTSELRDIIRQFMQKVEEFKMCLKTVSISLEEQQMVFKSMMEAQDQLERKYISRKEEHRALEMQNYLGVARNTGTFDPDRLVEGEIFRVGMHLEDIKELIDRNICEQFSPPPSSSTPCLTTPSPPPTPPLHEAPSPCFSIRAYETERKEEEEETEDSEVYGDEELTSADSLVNSTGQSSCSLRISHTSLERLNITTEEEEEEKTSVLSEGIGYDSNLTCLTGHSSSFRDRQWCPDRLPGLTNDEHSVSLVVEVSCSSEALRTPSLSDQTLSTPDQTLSTPDQTLSTPDQTLSTPQRIVSPETDSGFGSSDLSRPATGLSQPKLHADRQSVLSQSDVSSGQRSLSGSDSEGSNIQTTVHPALSQAAERRASLQTTVHPALNQAAERRASLQTTVHPALSQAAERRASLQTTVHPALSQAAERRASLQTTVHPALSQAAERRASLQTSPQPQTHPQPRSQPQLQTASQPVIQTHRRPQIQQSAESQWRSSAVGLWVESASQEDPGRLRDTETDFLFSSRLHHHDNDCHSITMDTSQRDSPRSCSCNSEAILSLQSEVSRLKRDLEEGLVQLPQLHQRMDHLTSRYSQDRRPRSRPRTHHKHPHHGGRSAAGSRAERQRGISPDCSLGKIDDWISSDMDPSKSKGTNSADSDGPETRLQFHSSPPGGRRGSSNPYTCTDSPGKPHSKKYSSRGSEENCSLRTPDPARSSPTPTRSPSPSPSSRLGKQGLSYPNTSYTTQTAEREVEGWSLSSKGRFSPLQKPLLQVNYGSSCSLPAGFKVREAPLQGISGHRRRMTQSDTALLPSNVFFQRTLPPALNHSKAGGRTRRKGSQEEEINRKLDQAIEAARSMKSTTDRMARSLSADLAKAQLHRKLHGMRPLGGRKHIAS